MKVIFFLMLFICSQSRAQVSGYRYNTDSLLHRLSVNTTVKRVLKQAGLVYKKAHIHPSNISLNAFKIAFLEKALIDSGFIQFEARDANNQFLYEKKKLLTIVDFTRAGNRKRWVTVDLAHRRLLHSTMVAHGTARGVNSKEEIPHVFSNFDGSNASSLGMVLAAEDDYPESLCHLCKYFLKRKHKCSVMLDGLENGINDQARKREIIVHTTGSKNYGDSSALARIAEITKNKTGDYLKNKNCYCYHNAQSSIPDYASQCGIADNGGYIGRSLGCLVLPEEAHIPVMETIKNGSLIFIYSDSIAPNSTNYFENITLH